MPNCTLSVSPNTISIFSIGTPSFSRDDLREGRLVTLAVIVRADQHGHLSGRMYPHGRALDKARRARRADPAMRDGARPQASTYVQSPMPRSLPLLADSALRLAKPAQSRCGQRPFQAALRIAAVIFDHDRRLIGIRLLGDHVAAADLGLVDAHLARRDVDQPLQHEGRLGPPGAAIGIDRYRVGEDTFHFAIDRGRRDRRRPAAVRRDWSECWDRRSKCSRPCWRCVLTRSPRNLPFSSSASSASVT